MHEVTSLSKRLSCLICYISFFLHETLSLSEENFVSNSLVFQSTQVVVRRNLCVVRKPAKAHHSSIDVFLDACIFDFIYLK